MDFVSHSPMIQPWGLGPKSQGLPNKYCQMTIARPLWVLNSSPKKVCFWWLFRANQFHIRLEDLGIYFLQEVFLSHKFVWVQVHTNKNMDLVPWPRQRGRAPKEISMQFGPLSSLQLGYLASLFHVIFQILPCDFSLKSTDFHQ